MPVIPAFCYGSERKFFCVSLKRFTCSCSIKNVDKIMFVCGPICWSGICSYY